MSKELTKQIILINAMRYLEFLRDTFNDGSIHEFNCLVFEAELALRTIQNINEYPRLSWNTKTLTSDYVRFRKIINLPAFRNKIFDLDDLTLYGGVLDFNSQYVRDERDYANGVLQ